MIRRVWALAMVTCREGLRDRSLYGIFLFSLFVLGLNIAIAGFFMRDIGKVTVDMNLAAISFAGLLLVFFIGINLISKDIDKKTIHLVLSRPLSRGEYIWGKFFGLVLVVVASLGVLIAFSVGTVAVVRGLYPDYFGDFSWTIYFLTVLFIFMQLMVLCAIVVFFSAISSSSFVTLIFSIGCYLSGVSLEEVVFYLKSHAGQELGLSDALSRLLEVVSWLIPNFAAFDFKVEAAHGLPLDTLRLFSSGAYGLAYIGVLLVLAALIFSRREFN
jgi:ABC-type transport system involved in multi-copper enzyme maturation permease subunit